MNRVLLTLFFIFSGTLIQAQTKTFLGLTIGQSYSEEEMHSIIEKETGGSYIIQEVKDKSDYITELKESIGSSFGSSIVDMAIPSISMSVVPKDSEKGHPSYDFNLTKKRTICSVSITYDSSCGQPEIVYKQLADSLSAIYPMESMEDGSIGIHCIDKQNTSVSLMKEESYVMVLFVDMEHMMKQYNSLFPDIQDKFLGMTLGEKYSIEEVKKNVGLKGEFSSKEREANGTDIYFKKVAFAGKLWDYSVISLSNNGEFSRFSVYDSMDDYTNERKEAKEIYDSYKEVLDKKYSSTQHSAESKEDDGISSLYVGRNGVGMELYNRRSRSKGGAYRRFVGMEYVHIGILNRNQQAKESDL